MTLNNIDTYRKSSKWAPHDLFYFESAGLKWLRSAEKNGGPEIVPVLNVDSNSLTIGRVHSSSPTSQAAFAFGKQLSRLHDSGASYFGCPPEDYKGVCYFGPLSDPVEMPTGKWDSVTDYFSQGRLLPLLKYANERHVLDNKDNDLTYKICDDLPHLLGEATTDRPARLHGDLWNGNVMWSKKYFTKEYFTAEDHQQKDHQQTEEIHAVLIDPCAHGGHREEDLAMLALFGAPYLEEIFSGYNSAHPLKKGWEQRITLWQLAPVLAHCVFFGGSYCSQYRSMCMQILNRVNK